MKQHRCTSDLRIRIHIHSLSLSLSLTNRYPMLSSLVLSVGRTLLLKRHRLGVTLGEVTRSRRRR